jgi:WD40 repeat protein
VKAGQPPSQLMEPYYQRIYSFCEGELPPDKPETMHWAYMNCVQKLVYIAGGHGFITLPTAKWELVRLWDRDELRGPRGAIPEFNDKVAGLQSDAAGKRLIMSVGNAVNSTDISIALDQDVEPVIFQGPGQRLGTALSPDGKYAATCRGAKIVVWDPATGQTQLDLAGEFEHAVMKFSPDSQRLLVVARGSMELFDPSNGNLLYKYAAPKGSATLNRVEHFIDGKSLLGYGNSTSGVAALVKWFPDEQKVVELNREGGSRYVTLDDVSRNYVLCSEVGRLGPIFHLFRLSDGKKMRTVEGHQTRVVSAVISPNETEFATVDLSGPIRFWKITP